jgi:hypothetical protein
MQDSKVANSDGWYVYKSSDEDGLFMPEMWDWETLEDYPLVQQEVKVIYSLLEVLIRSQAPVYGYYFGEMHDEEPSDLPTQWDENGEKKKEKIWKTVYDTPTSYYSKAYEYHIITTHLSDEFTYYAISKHGCSFQSALTEYVRIRNDDS